MESLGTIYWKMLRRYEPQTRTDKEYERYACWCRSIGIKPAANWAVWSMAYKAVFNSRWGNW